jgi:hypothetical protein
MSRPMIQSKISKISKAFLYQKGHATVIKEKNLRIIGTVGCTRYRTIFESEKNYETVRYIYAVFRIRIGFNADPDPAFLVTADPDQEPGF